MQEIEALMLDSSTNFKKTKTKVRSLINNFVLRIIFVQNMKTIYIMSMVPIQRQ